MTDKVVPFKVDDLEWEEPAARVRLSLAAEITDLARMASALKQRAGSWAVLMEYSDPKRASPVANQLRRKFPTFEFAGRKTMTGGSRVYVRVA